MMALFWGSKTGTGPAGAASLSAAADADADGDAQGGQSQQQQSPYAPLSEQQRQQLRQQVLQWLTGPEPTPASLAPLPLTNMRQLREVLYACKVSSLGIYGGESKDGNKEGRRRAWGGQSMGDMSQSRGKLAEQDGHADQSIALLLQPSACLSCLVSL